MSQKLDLTGQRYGRLVALERITKGGQQTKWRCRCDCGNDTTVQMGNLRGGKSRSCGCLTIEISRAMWTKHGETHRTPEYSIWKGMKARCRNPNHQSWSHYGARGIIVCDRWRHNFPAFLADMGRRPSELHSIDRINNDGNYSNENCRWAVAVTQQNNTTRNHHLTFNGQTHTIGEWARLTGLNRRQLDRRVRSGWSVSDILTLKTRERRQIATAAPNE